MEVKTILKTKKRLKGQAAITDAIILLLIAAFSSTLIFSFVGEWGNDQDSVLRSAYVLNYMQSVVKAMYYVDASTLENIGNDGLDVYGKEFTGNPSSPFVASDEYDLDDADFGCRVLENYPGTLRVTDLLKRDLGDSVPSDLAAAFSSSPPTGLPYLDDKFGEAKVPGRTAMRCVMKELMKPFAFSGYRYYSEVLYPRDTTLSSDGTPVSFKGPEITNSRDPAIAGIELGDDKIKRVVEGASQTYPGCHAVGQSGYDVIAVSSPFQVLFSHTETSDSNPTGVLTSTFVPYTIRLCIWKANPTKELE
ncbi:MAG TPA: hypothetical protein VJI71_01175 [Candidatus Norongarragalinales archaeon]|nr:hypothetical protein [Candidatus Norongarragalinales archaeon]